MSRALWLSSGVIVWAAHFSALYGFTSFACARHLPGAVPWVAGAATLVALALLGFIIHRRCRGDFEGWLTAGLAGAALVAVLYEAIPLFIVPACE